MTNILLHLRRLLRIQMLLSTISINKKCRAYLRQLVINSPFRKFAIIHLNIKKSKVQTDESVKHPVVNNFEVQTLGFIEPYQVRIHRLWKHTTISLTKVDDKFWLLIQSDQITLNLFYKALKS
uniref:Uncharacterized protein n=1 Tax=Arundo donax TaxID=35708 RepID=A0A0A9D1G1_ARUDO